MKQAHQFTGDVMKCLFTWTDCCLNHMLLLLWAILFYIVNANDANWERMTRHNKSSPNTIEYFQRFLFRILCRFFVLFSTCFFSPFWFACVRVFLSGNLFYFFFSREKKKSMCGRVVIYYFTYVRHMKWFSLIWSWVNMKMMTGLKKQTTKSSLELRRWHRMMRYIPFDVRNRFEISFKPYFSRFSHWFVMRFEIRCY